MNDEYLEFLRKNLLHRAELWRTAKEDPYNINYTMFIVLTEVANAILTLTEEYKSHTKDAN